MTANLPNFEGHQPRDCGEHRTVGAHRAWCFDCSEWCYPTSDDDGAGVLDSGCVGCCMPTYRANTERLAAVGALIAHARKISPSPSMHVYVADLERALGIDAPRPHKLGGGDA